MGLKDTGIKISDHFFKKGLHGPVIFPEIIAQVNIQVDLLIFRPGMDRDMAFAKAYNTGKPTGIEAVIDFSKLLQLVLRSKIVYQLFKAACVA